MVLLVMLDRAIWDGGSSLSIFCDSTIARDVDKEVDVIEIRAGIVELRNRRHLLIFLRSQWSSSRLEGSCDCRSVTWSEEELDV